MANYLHRLDAIEERLGIRDCGEMPCVKCILAKLHADLHGGEFDPCDNRPLTVEELSRDVLTQGLADVRALRATEAPTIDDSEQRSGHQ